MVVAVGGLSRDIRRAAWLLRPWELSLHHIVALVMSIEAKTQRVPRTWFERLKMWRHAYEVIAMKLLAEDRVRQQRETMH